jgi:16S rRNA (adenine1518-N6/adenine1519-N6)-dimethyltransferase
VASFPEANKSLGQHFLRDERAKAAIANDFADRARAIIEVGPGPGVLTQGLAAHGLPITLVEKDARFPELLKEFVAEENIILTDALEVNWEELIGARFGAGPGIWLASNLPYNVATPLLVAFLQAPSLSFMTLMFQREVADKVFAFDTREGKEMNSLMSLTQTFFDVKLLTKLPPGAFSPPPKVDSAVLSFERKENPVIEPGQFLIFETFLRKLFAHRRKQAQGVLKSYYTQEAIAAAFESAGIIHTARAESFKLEQVQLLFKLLNK